MFENLYIKFLFFYHNNNNGKEEEFFFIRSTHIILNKL